MLASLLISTLLAAATANPWADLLTPAVDSNSAFYQGNDLSYVFGAPEGYRLVLDEAARYGYSLAFIPEAQEFDSADVLIAATIYSTGSKKTSFARVLADDTVAIRDQYGPTVEMWGVDSVLTGTREIIPTVYVRDRRAFIPTVMVSYYNGGSEIVIFELIISDRCPRFKAEPDFEKTILLFRALRPGDPSKFNLGSTEPEED